MDLRCKEDQMDVSVAFLIEEGSWRIL